MTARHSVFFGDVAEDEYYATPHFPLAGDKVIVQTLPAQFGGSVANAASIYAHFGMPTSFISQLNSGPLTQRLLGQMREQGIDTGHVIFDEDVPDSKCIILLHGEQHIVLIPTLGITHSEIVPATFEHMADAEFIVSTLTDVKPFRRGPQGPAEILESLRRRGARMVLDLDVYNAENQGSGLLEHCDILFMNSLGASRFEQEGQSISRLLDGGATAIVITRDSEGCELHHAGGIVEVPGIPVEVVDVTGAGDTFTSSFLYAYSLSGDLVEAAEFANAAASLAVGTVGARGGLTTRDAVDAFRRSTARTP
ncbi:carbohydrate kinase family protein [Microbacterium capsulatum]|uniref:Carbohydrate kinase family protein n=1 Tax=Microbacterium capsulatum TaxID=3041921 RepID=A0ABU0XJ67_9MICO|nr:carbohydrate kinase family protein [Microbacterium sp. ASV81]MDQ4215177.1 carbohydrate kinase family protein [Microbacterium sp. ASV81]